MSQRSMSANRLALAAPAALTAVLGAIGLSSRQLWQDELATWWATALPGTDLTRLISQHDLTLAPYYALMHGWVTITGTSPVALRLPSLLAMVLAAALVTALGRRLLGVTGGVAGGLLFAVIPAISRYAQEARPYALVLAAAALSTLLLLRVLDRPTALRWADYGFALAVTVSLHLVAALLLLAHAAWVWQRRRGGRAPAAWLATTAIALVPGVALTLDSFDQREQVSWIDTTWLSALMLLSDLTASIPVAIGLILLAALGTARGWREHRDTLFPLLIWAAAPPLLLLAVSPLADLVVPRYLLFTLPAWALLAASGVASLLLHTSLPVGTSPLPSPQHADAAGPLPTAESSAAAKPLPRFAAKRGHFAARSHALLQNVTGWRAGGLVLVVLVVLVVGLPGVVDQVGVRRDPSWAPDFRGAAVVIGERALPGDGLAYADASWRERLGTTYHLPATARWLPDPFAEVSAAERGDYAVAECPAPRTCLPDEIRRLWFVTTTIGGDPFAGLPSGKAAVLREEFTIASTMEFTELRLLLLMRSTNPS
ncbi:mannosyltransferase [Allocatelliglobosispora scoriae]|uniref:Mannosyltransferase n=1 Tax=Allocatelliglobosispora scoriae TaxID=643052 RepID=A0A841C292_9ACTN|nr:glycosyltransferase family 39 protein [Allocatelliglobosispora scoriae]MBB5873172.1 mannosyltransferase [Allocatelliglobosispora scoriae]